MCKIVMIIHIYKYIHAQNYLKNNKFFFKLNSNKIYLIKIKNINSLIFFDIYKLSQNINYFLLNILVQLK